MTEMTPAKFTKTDIAEHPNPNCLWVRVVDYDAVVAERDRLREAITLIERTYYIEGKSPEWRAAHMNGISREALGESND